MKKIQGFLVGEEGWGEMGEGFENVAGSRRVVVKSEKGGRSSGRRRRTKTKSKRSVKLGNVEESESGDLYYGHGPQESGRGKVERRA